MLFLWVEFQITLGNFSGIRGAFWDLFDIKDDYLTLQCFTLSMPSEPVIKKKTKNCSKNSLIHSKIRLELHTNSSCRTLGNINYMVIYFALCYTLLFKINMTHPIYSRIFYMTYPFIISKM